MRRLTREQQREIAAIAAKRDEEIDLSEMPEVIDWSEAEVGKLYRPPKKPVTMRMDAERGGMAQELRARLPDQGQHPSTTRYAQYPAAKSAGKRWRA